MGIFESKARFDAEVVASMKLRSPAADPMTTSIAPRLDELTVDFLIEARRQGVFGSGYGHPDRHDPYLRHIVCRINDADSVEFDEIAIVGEKAWLRSFWAPRQSAKYASQAVSVEPVRRDEGPFGSAEVFPHLKEFLELRALRLALPMPDTEDGLLEQLADALIRCLDRSNFGVSGQQAARAGLDDESEVYTRP